MSVLWRVACELVSLIGSYSMTGQHSQPTPTSLGKGVWLFRCILSPALLVECTGFFKCHCGNTGVGWTTNKNQNRKLTLEIKFLPPLLPRIEPTTLR